jgi:hypothetical protein
VTISQSKKNKSTVTPEERQKETFGVKDETENVKRQREDYAVQLRNKKR